MFIPGDNTSIVINFKVQDNILGGFQINSNNKVVILSDAPFTKCDGKTSYEFCMTFNDKLVVAGAYRADGRNSAKEAEMCAIFCSLKRAKGLGILKAQVLSDTLEVVKALNGENDWSIKGLIDF